MGNETLFRHTTRGVPSEKSKKKATPTKVFKSVERLTESHRKYKDNSYTDQLLVMFLSVMLPPLLTLVTIVLLSADPPTWFPDMTPIPPCNVFSIAIGNNYLNLS